jgi:hypothetical protein
MKNKLSIVAVLLSIVALVGVFLIKPAGNANLGAVAGPDVYSYLSVHGNLSTDGTFTSTGAITSSGSVSGLTPTTAISTSTVLTTASTGGTYYISAGGTITLPTTASSSGISYRFVIASAVSADVIISSAGGSSGDDIEGSLIVAGAVVDCTANDIITFVSDGEDVGDFVQLYSNGTKWFIGSSNGLTAAKITCTG